MATSKSSASGSGSYTPQKNSSTNTSKNNSSFSSSNKNSSSSSSFWDKMTGGTDYSRNPSLAGQTVMQGNIAVTYDDNGYAIKGVNTSTVQNGGGSGGSSGSSTSFTPSDYSQYLKDMYANNIAAQLAGLKDTYEQNVADLQANAEKIPEVYQSARNDAAAQNDIARQSFNEFAVANGLNTGSAGQAALANSSVLQSNLSDLSGRESDALAENALEQQRLAIAYRNAVDQAQAQGNYELAAALYNEYVRQDNLAAQAAADAQAQKNWEAEFGFTQQQYQDSLNQYQDSLNATNRDYAYNLAMTMLQAGLMPDSSTLTNAGISSADALAIRNSILAAQNSSVSSSSGSSSVSSSSRPSSGSSVSSGSSSGSSGSKNTYTSSTSNGMDTSQYTQFYNLLRNNLANDANTGRDTAKYSVQSIDAVWNQLSSTQQSQIMQLLNQYGYQYNP